MSAPTPEYERPVPLHKAAGRAVFASEKNRLLRNHKGGAETGASAPEYG